jgi:hypothetical protein
MNILTLCNTRTVTFKLVSMKRGTRDIYILYSCLCQLVVICELLFVQQSIVHLFCSLFDYLFCFHFYRFLAYLLFKREKSNSDPEPCSSISIPLTVTHKAEEVFVVPVQIFNIIISSQKTSYSRLH